MVEFIGHIIMTYIFHRMIGSKLSCWHMTSHRMSISPWQEATQEEVSSGKAASVEDASGGLQLRSDDVHGLWVQ